MTQKVFTRVVVTIIATISIGYILSQEPVLVTAVSAPQQQQQSISNQTEIVGAKTPQERANLERFDKGTFDGWNKKNWTLYRNVHTPDVLAVGFSENTTKGIDPHVQWALETAKSNNKIIAHPIKIAVDNWTVVTGITAENISMVTVARWEEGKIAEEYAFIQTPT
ncbi:MAG TPA: hypothetical protein VD815_06085 [Candidatus Saccharimonadales bacterium]|nr:hypothetical protein [Candidatus Saccharimonadales bacterium]